MADTSARTPSQAGHAGEPEITREVLQRSRNRLARMHKMLRRYG